MHENQISHVFWKFLLLAEEDMASSSKAFREFNRECHPKVNTCSHEVVRENFSDMAECYKKQIQQSSWNNIKYALTI